MKEVLLWIDFYKNIIKNSGSLPIGVPLFCFSMMFPTVKKQFSIKCLTTTFSKLQVNPIQPLTFLPQEEFSLVLTLTKVLLPPWKKIFVRKVHQDACHVVIYCKYPKFFVITQKLSFFMNFSLIINKFKDRRYRFGKSLNRTQFGCNIECCPTRMFMYLEIQNGHWRSFSLELNWNSNSF